MGRLATAILVIVGAAADPTPRSGPTDGLTIRLVRPDRQLEALLELFRGTGAPHPAAALAAWKRANPAARGLGKSAEAAIAALNPGMVRELRGLDEARLGLGIDPADGHVRWYAVAPRDDGSFGGLATALVLTDGGPDAPFEGLAVDRLGPPGAPLSVRSQGALTLAGSRNDLPAAVRPSGAAAAGRPGIASGLAFRLEPAAIASAGPLATRRVVEAVRGAGCRDVEGTLVLADETIELATMARLDSPPGTPAIDPSWLDWVPASAVSAAIAVAIDPGPKTWDGAFAWADRIERVDPARAEVAPLRVRLNLAAAAAGVRPEVDLWPKLRGLTAFAAAGATGNDVAVVVALHVADPGAAGDLASGFVPRLVARWLKGPEPAPGPDGIRRLGLVSGLPLEVAQKESTVLIGWGGAGLASALEAKAVAARSAGPAIRASWGESPPQRAGALWPGRLGAAPLDDAPPVVWSGRNDGTVARDVVRWAGLRGVVRRAVGRLPLAPG